MAKLSERLEALARDLTRGSMPVLDADEAGVIREAAELARRVEGAVVADYATDGKCSVIGRLERAGYYSGQRIALVPPTTDTGHGQEGV
jgi:hypothetical protein